MKLATLVVAVLIGSSAVAQAQHSTARPSEASVGASVMGGLSAAWIAHEGSEFTVQSTRAVGDGLELSLRSVGTGIETSALVAREAAAAASLAVGTSVRVVAETTGYALVAAGRVIAFVPNEVARGLVHRSSH